MSLGASLSSSCLDPRRRVARLRALLLVLLAATASLPAGSPTHAEAPAGAGGPGPTAPPVAVHLRDAAGAWTDATDAARSPATMDVPLPGGVGSGLYVGHDQPFDELEIAVAVAGEAGALAWEYRAQDGWRELNPSDATEGLTRAGTRRVSLNPPPDWTPAVLESASAPGLHYYVRTRVTTAYDTAPTLSQIRLEAWADPGAAYLLETAAWNAPGTGTTTNLNDVALRGQRAVAVGNNGLLLRSLDGGTTWASASSGLAAHLNGVSAASDSLWFAAGRTTAESGDGLLYRSLDGGATWSQVRSVAGGATLFDVAAASPTVAVAGGLEVLLRTTDGGANWQPTTFPGVTFHALQFLDATHGWAAGDRPTGPALYRTMDGGASWTEMVISSALHPDVHYVKDVQFLSEDYGWIVGDGFRARTLNGGESWVVLTGTGILWKAIHLASPTTGWVVGDLGSLWRVENADAPLHPNIRWTPQNQEPTMTFKGLVAASIQEALVVGGKGVILRTPDAGHSWLQPYASFEGNLHEVDAAASDAFWAAGAAGRVYRSTDGHSWTRHPTGSVEALRAVDFVSAERGWVVGDRGTVLRTDDGGVNWTQQNAQGVEDLLGVEFIDGSKGWAVGALGKILRTANGGASWTVAASGVTTTLRGVAFVGSDTVVAVGDGGTIVRSTNGGVAWSPVTSGSSSPLHSVYFPTPTRGWAVGDSGTILSSITQGETWLVQSPAGIPEGLVDVHALDPQRAWAVGEAGRILRSNDAGAHWSTQDAGSSSTLRGVAAFSTGTAVVVGDEAAARRTGTRWTDATATLRTADGQPDALAATLSSGDSLYVAHADPFDSVLLWINRSASGAVLAWEYWNGEAWIGVQEEDGTSDFSHTGLRVVRYPLPGDWSTNAPAPGSPVQYYLRVRFLQPPEDRAVLVQDAAVLRLQNPLNRDTTTTTTTTTSTSTSASGSPGDSTTPQRRDLTDRIPGFQMAADPQAFDLGPLTRGARENRTLRLVAVEGEAAASLELQGSAARWATLSTSQLTLRTNVTVSVGIDVWVPNDATPGPHRVLILVYATPTGSTQSVLGWVPVDLVVEAADLVSIGYQPDPPAWRARFANYLERALDVRFDATVQGPGQEPIRLDSQRRSFASGSNDTVEGALDTAGLAPGPYELVVTAVWENTTSTKRATIYLGGPPVEVDAFRVTVEGRERVEFEFLVRNLLDYPVRVRPQVELINAAQVTVAVLTAGAQDLEPREERRINLTWPAELGVYTARARAVVENAAPAAPAESTFAVQGSRVGGPGGLGATALYFAVAAVLVVNVLVGLGLWTGRNKPPTPPD